MFADKQVFPKLDVVGWYATGSGQHSGDVAMHRRVRAAPSHAHIAPAPAGLRLDLNSFSKRSTGQTRLAAQPSFVACTTEPCTGRRFP